MSDERQANAERLDLVQDYAQGLPDILISDQVLEHIPVVKTLSAAVKAVASVRDAILVQKIAAFLESLSEIPPAERAKMVRRLEADPSYSRKVGLHLIELLDGLDSHRKPGMVGLCFTAFAQERIDRMQLQRLIAAIERLPTAEIDSVRKFLNSKNNPPERDRLHPESVQALVNAGLARSTSGPMGGKVTYIATATCGIFVNLNLDVRSAS
jgi:hypothetical protein